MIDSNVRRIEVTTSAGVFVYRCTPRQLARKLKGREAGRLMGTGEEAAELRSASRKLKVKHRVLGLRYV